MEAPVLDRRTLNRTLLERQGLLRRSPRSVADVIESLVGMQAQEPQNPFVALWSRLDAFEPGELDALLLERQAVRTALMRTTLHLVTAEDALELHPLFARVLARTLRAQRQFRAGLDGLDLEDLVEVGARRLAQRPISAGELRPHLTERWPDRDPSVLMMAIRYLVPIVQVPPRGLWRQSRQPILTTLEAWLGRAPDASGDVESLVLRYLRAFGPATVGDVRTWSGLAGLAAVVDRLRPRLRTFRDEAGRELVDVPDAPIIDAGAPAPVRFLPEFDNVFLSHADRSRIVELPLDLGRYQHGTVLVDGFVSGGWRRALRDGRATLTVTPFRALARRETTEVADEGQRLLRFLEPDAQAHTARFV